MAARFTAYSPDDTLTMPIAKVLFLYEGMQVLDGLILPEKHLSEEDETHIHTAIDRADELKGMFEKIKKGEPL